MPIAYTAPGWEARDIGTLVNARIAANQYLDQQKADAIRWQATQDYETLVKSGVPAQEAYRRLAPRMFYGDPRGLAGTIAPVSRQYFGTRTVRLADGTQMKVTMDYPQWQQAPSTNAPPPTPRIEPIPGSGGQQMIVQPSGTATVVPQARQNLVEIPAVQGVSPKRVITQGRARYESAQVAAAPLVKEYKDLASKVSAGKTAWRWQSPYTNQMAEIEAKLNKLGLDTNAMIMPRSTLDAAVRTDPILTQELQTQGQLPAPAAMTEAAPAAAPVPTRFFPRRMPPPPARVYMGPNRPIGGDQYQEFRRPGAAMISAPQYPPAITDEQLRARGQEPPPPAAPPPAAAPPAAPPRGTARSGWEQAAPTMVYELGPNEVLATGRAADGTRIKIILNTKTGQRRWATPE